MSDLGELDALGLAALVKKREISPAELVEDAIRRIEQVNPALNAVITPMFDLARNAAAGPVPEGPFQGVPFLLKDLVTAYAGVPLTSSCRFTKDVIPRHDSELVKRYKRAGLLVVGKTNTPELGLPPTTEPLLHGPTRNPWDVTRTPGGSSGGSAAAVAARMVPMAHGGDGGGSIRIPASCCGVFGLKPTRGRLPLGPDIGDIMHGLVNEHALTRSVRDSAALLDATAGMDIGAPYDAPAPRRPYLEETQRPPGKLRISWSVKPMTPVKIHPDCIAAVHDAVKLLTELGHDVVEEDFDIPGQDMLTQSFVAVWAGGCAATIDAMAFMVRKTPTEADFEPMTWAMYQMGKSVPLPMYLLGVMQLQKLSRDLQWHWHKRSIDVRLLPTLAEPPLPLGTLDAQPGNPLAGFFRSAEFVPFTPLVNVTGQPAMSVPLHWSAAGLPIGTQFIGRFGDEGTLLSLAAQLESARPWAGRRPPVCATAK